MKSTNRGSQARKSPFTSPLISRQRPRTRLLGAWNPASAASLEAAWEYPWSDGTGFWGGAGLEKMVVLRMVDMATEDYSGWEEKGVDALLGLHRAQGAFQSMKIGWGGRLKEVLGWADNPNTKIQPLTFFT